MASSQAIKQSLFARHKNTSHRSKSAISSMKIAIYVSVFAVLVGVIAIGYQSPEKGSARLSQATALGNAVVVGGEDEKGPSVDEIVATDVAAGLAERTNLPIAPTVANTAVSLSAKSEIAQTSDEVITKPQIVQSLVKSRDIESYVAKKGDTVSKVAEKYNISANTLRWANNLESDVIPKGKKLKILPVNGVLHTVGSGESVSDIADLYNTEAARIVSYNDLEINDAKRGRTLLIPGGILPQEQRPGYEDPSQNAFNGFGGDVSIVSNNVMATAGNRYAPGYCTWYVYERRAADGNEVGSFWGNAVSWAGSARAAGFRVNNTPAPGAVIQTGGGGGGYGHVGYVERVDSKGNVYIREMNYAGFNVVSSRTISSGQARSYTYIH